MAKYDWPPLEGLIALVKKHGQTNAAQRLGVPTPSLHAHLVRKGVSPEDRQQETRTLNDDALKEIRDLLDS